MPSLDDRIYALIERLTDATQSGTAKWALGPKPNSFVTSSPADYRIEIRSSGGGRTGSYPYTLVLKDPQNQVIDEIESLDAHLPLGPWDNVLRDLYSAARASALDVDGAINTMLRDLGVDPDEVPPRPVTEDDIPF